MRPLAVDVVSDPSDLDRLAPAWTELADAVGARPFSRPSWCLPWWSTVGKGRPAVVTVRDGSELLAVAPLHRRRRPLVDSVRFMGHGLGSVSALVVAHDRSDAAHRVWSAALGGRRVVELVEYDERGPGLDQLTTGPWESRIEPRDVCPTIEVDGDPDSFLASRPADLRRILRRAERKVTARDTTHAVEVAVDREGVERLLPAVVQVTDRAESANPRQHLLRGHWAGFTRAMLAAVADDGRLRLFVSRVGDDPAGFALTLADDGGLAMWFNRHDPAFADVSPGHLLIREMVRHVGRDGGGRVDLLIGDFRYKRLWSTTEYRTLTVTAAGQESTLSLATRQDAAVGQLRRARDQIGERLRSAESAARPGP